MSAGRAAWAVIRLPRTEGEPGDRSAKSANSTADPGADSSPLKDEVRASRHPDPPGPGSHPANKG